MTELVDEHILDKNQVETNTMESHSNCSPRLVVYTSGIKKSILAGRMRLAMAASIFRLYRNPIKTFKVMQSLISFRKKVGRNHNLTRFARIGERYYWDLYTPGFPSVGFNDFTQSEANRILPQRSTCNKFVSVIISITNKCSYKCEHCYEWELLNKKEDLPMKGLQTIISKFQKLGAPVIHFSGGEPMLRVNELIELLKTSDGSTQFWLATSGYGLDRSNALKLKKAGLTGVSISLDDHNPELHNAFRGYKHAYDKAILAVRSSVDTGLVTALSLCLQKEKVTDEFLMSYLEKARSMGVSIIQILEPKAVGHYRSKDVELDKAQEQILEDFFLKINFTKGFEDYPIILYHGHHQRKSGCLAAGDRVIYVDGEGHINPCPFCKKKGSNALDENLEDGIEKLRKEGCLKYQE